MKDIVNGIQCVAFATSSLSSCNSHRCRVISNYMLYAAVPRYVSQSRYWFPDRIFIDFSLPGAHTGLLPEIKPQSFFSELFPIAVELLRNCATRSEILTTLNKT